MVKPQTPTGIQILETRDCGPFLIESFAILPGGETTAAKYLLEALSDAELTLMNGEDEGGEGCTSIRWDENGFESRSGGHGWQGEWMRISLDQARSRVIELADFNRGGHWSRQGSVTRPRR